MFSRPDGAGPAASAAEAPPLGPLTGRSTRSYLFALALSLLLPTLLVAGYLAWRFGISERVRFEQQAVDLARNAAITVERELRGITTALEVLATAEALERQDFEAFHKRAVQVSGLHEFNITLRDLQSRQIANSGVPWGEPLPERTMLRDIDEMVIQGGRPAVSDHFRGIVNARDSVGIVVPVRRGEALTHLLSASFDVERLRRALAEELPQGWTASLFDRKRVSVTNTAFPTRAGQVATPLFRERIDAVPTGVWEGVNPAGERVLSAFRQLPMGWTVAAGAPEAEWRAAQWRNTILIALGSLALIGVALSSSLVLARGISGPFAALSAMGTALGRGEPATLRTFGNREANALARTLAAASIGIRDRDAELRASSIRYRNALRVGRIGAWETDMVAGVRRWSDEGMALFGIDLPGGIGQVGGPNDEWRRAFHPEDRPVADQIHAELRTRDRINTEYRIRRPDGRILWLLGHGEVAKRDPDGSIRRLTNVVADITDRKRAEEALQRSEARLQAALRAGRLGVYDYDPRSGELRWNELLHEMWSVPPGRPVTIAIFESAVHPDDLAKVREGIASVLAADGARLDIEYRIIRPRDGATRWLVAEGQAAFEDGRPARLVGMVRDVTDEKQAEAARRLLLEEMNHRVKNVLATVRAVAMQTFRGGKADPEARDAFEGRLMALAAAHDLLIKESWTEAGLAETVRRTLLAHCESKGGRLSIEGPDLAITPKAALAISMSLHELATNALKYGALSNEEGRVALSWTAQDGRLRLVWTESGGPPVSAPERRGFGSNLIERVLGSDLGGAARLSFDAGGVVCVIEADLARIRVA